MTTLAKKECEFCGRLFTPGTKKQKYCHLKRDGRNCQLKAQAAKAKYHLRVEYYKERKKPEPIANPRPVFMDACCEWQKANRFPVGGYSGLPRIQTA